SSFAGGGVNRAASISQWMTQEITVATSGQMAESGIAGMQINYVPKAGGNTFHGTLSGNYAGEKLQGSNLDDTLRARGVTAEVPIRRIYEVGGGLGGPIVKDRAWFYISGRKYEASRFVPGAFFNSTPHSVVYTPDPSQRAFTGET